MSDIKLSALNLVQLEKVNPTKMQLVIWLN